MINRLPAYRFDRGTAVVTGAAGGIGEQLAHGLARRGSSLVLLDRDAVRLNDVAASIGADHPDVSVRTLVVDLGDRGALDHAAAQLCADHPDTTLLINNAGVALTGEFAQLTLDEFDWLMAINFHAPVRLTHHLLPLITRQPGGHVVNVSSLFGLIAPAGQSAYCASKFGLRGFSEVLRGELAAAGTGVTTVHPGGIRTRIAVDARIGANVAAEAAAGGLREFDKLLTFPADRAAEMIIDAVEHRRPRLLIGLSAQVPDALARLFPTHNMAVYLRLARAARRLARRTN